MLKNGLVSCGRVLPMTGQKLGGRLCGKPDEIGILKPLLGGCSKTAYQKTGSEGVVAFETAL
jgi:hypothetical protein